MTPPDQEARRVFDEALVLTDPSQRSSFLERECVGKEVLRHEVESLLQAHDQAGDFLAPTVQVPSSDFALERTGVRIGRYKLLEKIGEGGFGVVYMAEQLEPVHRKVALKIIKAGMDTREVVARFEAERQALALMDHPNIARVLDAGATEAGRPFFVMELVRGIPITSYCDQARLSTHDRLQLFMKVCQAVQHAHQKGIIHRDLKPNNVLVTLHDGEPVPKVIDFGVAKAFGQRLTEKTLFTGFAQMIGTPAYMSPEQAELSGLDIDTRSDIYSLGVLLYELLTGGTPFDAETLRGAALDEIRRVIRETEPPKPSTRLQTMGEGLPEVARRRQIEPAELRRLVRGDLDWIVMRCLEKDRRRRYDTPSALAQDLARYLNSEPVLANPPSPAYLFGKFVRRHRTGVSVGTALVLILLVGAGVSLWQAARAGKQAELAETRRRESESSRREATQARSRAEELAREVSHQLARQYVDKAAQRLDEGDLFGALVWSAEALRLDEDNPAAAPAQRLRVGSLLQQCPVVRQIFFHKAEVLSVEFSSDGERLLTAGSDKTARVWDLHACAPLIPTVEHGDLIVCASFSPDGHKVLTASFDHTARIWDAHTGAPLAAPMAHASNVWSAVFSPDGRRVVTASEDQTARVWDAATGLAVPPPLRHAAAVWPAAFSPDSRQVLTASQDHTARVWDAVTGQPVTPPLQHDGAVWWAGFSPDGKLIATASQDHAARIWDAASGRPVTAPLQHSEEVTYAAFSRDGRRLVTASGESIVNLMDFKNRPGEARVWDVATGKALTPPMAHKLSVFQAMFSPDGRWVATASFDKSARIWDAATGEPITPPLQHNDMVFRLCFSPDGARLATAGFDHTARVWELVNRLPTPVSLQESLMAGRFRFSSDDRLVAGTFYGGGAGVWDAGTGRTNTLLLHDTNLLDAVLSPDGRLLATAGGDHTLHLWDAMTGASALAPIIHQAKVIQAAFSPDGERVLTASEDSTTRIWSVRTGAPLAPAMRHGSNVLCAVFSPDGRCVCTGSQDKTARLWDSQKGAAVSATMAHEDEVCLAVFSPDGVRLATATGRGLVRIWDAATGRLLTSPMSHGGRTFITRGIEQIAFSPDGGRIVVSDDDRTARVWDTKTGAAVTPPLKHLDCVVWAGFSHDGRYVVTASFDRTARVWDAATGQALTPPLPQAGIPDCAVFTQDDRAVRTASHSEKGGFIQTWALVSDPRPAREVLSRAQLLALRRVDASGTLVPLELDSLTNAAWRVH